MARRLRTASPERADHEDGRTHIFHRVCQVEDDPCQRAGGKVERTALETFGDGHGRVLRDVEHIVCRTGEVGREVRHEIQPDDHQDKADDERLHHIAVRDGQDDGEHVEHAGQRSQRQELVARQDDGEEQRDGNKQQRYDECRRVADDQGRTHADVQTGILTEFAGYHLARGIGNGAQTFDEQSRDARNQLHDGSHLDTQSEDTRNAVHQFLPVLAGQCADAASHQYAEEERFAQDAEFLLHALRVDIQFVEPRNQVERLVDEDGERHEPLAERLRDGDAVHLIIEFLEFGSRIVGGYQRQDITDDGSEETPCDVVHRVVDHRADESEMPIVPQVDVDGLCRFGEEHQDVHSEAYGNDECAYRRVVSPGGCRRTSHVEHFEVALVHLHHF